MVKDELNSEEKFFENAVKAERFVKKYRNAIIGGISAVVVLVVANTLYEADREASLEAANAAYMVLLENGDDVAAKEELKRLNPDLYDMWSLSTAVASKDVPALEKLSASKAIGVSDLASYELAALNRDQKALDAYTLRQHAIYKELAAVESAMLLLQEGNAEAARTKLGMVSKESPLFQVAQLLMHYGVK
jgi:BarA-like signal transduction histidine kinase